MELPDVVRHIVDEAGFGPFCMGLSCHPASRTLLGALVERWWDTTNSFNFSAAGDMTMTLYDFSMLMGLDVAGQPIPYDADMGEWEAAWTYLLGAHPLINISSGRVRYTWFAEQYRRTMPETVEEIEQYDRGFLMFLLGTTLFSGRGNTVGLYLLRPITGPALWVYAYFPTLAPKLKVEAPLEIPYSRRFKGQCRPRPQETLPYLRHYFDIVRATEIIWQPWLAMPGYSWFQFAGTMGNPAQEIPSAPPLDMRSTESLTPREVDDLMLGVDVVLFLEKGEYATYRHTNLIKADTSRGGAREMPSTCQYARWPDLLTDLTGWQYGTSYSIPLEPPLPDHRYVSDPNSPPPPREYNEGLLGVVASLESMVLRREMLLYAYGIL
ncbi:Protein MAIN-LIKE 2, partial [Camellia lanceoleosa]